MRSKPVGRDDVDLVVAQQSHGARQLVHVERQVGVGVEHEVAGCGREAGLHRAAELAVAVVVDHADVGIGGRHRVGDLGRAVGRLVVDDDQLVVGDVARLDQVLAGALAESQGALDVVLLVPHRVEDRQLLERLTLGRRRHRAARVAARPGALRVSRRASAGRFVSSMSRDRTDGARSRPSRTCERRAPRGPGELTGGWRLVTGVTWMLVVVGARLRVEDERSARPVDVVARAARANRNSIVVQLLPFVPAVLMVLAAINHVRHLPWFGLAASGLIVRHRPVRPRPRRRARRARDRDRCRRRGRVARVADGHVPHRRHGDGRPAGTQPAIDQPMP